VLNARPILGSQNSAIQWAKAANLDQNIGHGQGSFPSGFGYLVRFRTMTENPRVGGSIPPLATINHVSIPMTSATVYAGDMGDSFAAKWFSALSIRHVSSSK